MPKLIHWIRVHKRVPVFTEGIRNKLVEKGVAFAGGEFEVFQHIHVNASNREEVIDLLEKEGYCVEDVKEGHHD